MRLRVLTLLLLSIPVLAACNSGRTYPSNKGDDEYDLAAMALRETDMPRGFTAQPIDDASFDNERWANEVFDTSDPEAKQAQLDAQGRLTNHVAAFAPPGLGKILSITAVSTLYTNEKAAEEAIDRFACGLPIDEKTPLTPFITPKIADQSTGFFVSQDSGSGLTFIDTTMCFRTGRIVHAFQQTSLPGVEDIAAAVRLADRWLVHIDAAFDGKAEPAPEETGTP